MLSWNSLHFYFSARIYAVGAVAVVNHVHIKGGGCTGARAVAVGKRTLGEISIAIVLVSRTVPVHRAANGYRAAGVAIRAHTYAIWGRITLCGFHIDHSLRNGDVTTFAACSTTNSSTLRAARCSDRASCDGDVAACPSVTTAYTGIDIARCRDITACNGDVATFSILTASNARRFATSACIDSTACDRDGAAVLLGSTSYSSTISAALGINGAALDDNIAAALAASNCANARRITVLTCCQRACPLNGQRFPRGHMNARITVTETLDIVRTFENKRGIAITSEAGPLIGIFVNATDVHIV